MKKGFTLVELLAVIVILAIILVIAIPSITNVIENSKKSTLANNAKVVLKSLKLDYDAKHTSGTFTDTFILYDSGVKTTYPSANNMAFSFSDVIDGGIVIYSDGTTMMAVHDGTNCATKLRTSSDIVVTTDTKTNCIANIYVKQATAPYTNLITNGDFSSGATNWTVSRSSVVNGKMRTVANSGVDAYFLQTVAGFVATNKIYTRFDFERNLGQLLVNNSPSYPYNTTGTYSVVYVEDNTTCLMDNQGTGMDTDYYVDNIIALNLTTLYGAGNEPTATQMDNNISKVWIDSATNIPKKLTAGGWVSF